MKLLEKKLITEEEGNAIWAEMLKKKRKIGASSFSEFLNSKTKECKAN